MLRNSTQPVEGNAGSRGSTEQMVVGRFTLTRYVGEAQWHHPVGAIAHTTAARRLKISPHRLDVLAEEYGLEIARWQVGKQEHGLISEADVAWLEERLGEQRRHSEKVAAYLAATPSLDGGDCHTAPDYRTLAAAFKCGGRGRGVLDRKGYHPARYKLDDVAVALPSGGYCKMAVNVRLDQTAVNAYRLVISFIEGGGAEASCWLRQLVAEYSNPSDNAPSELQMTKRLIAGGEWLSDVQVAGEVISNVLTQLRAELVDVGVSSGKGRMR